MFLLYNKHRMTQCNATAKSTGKRCSKEDSKKHNGFCHCHQKQAERNPQLMSILITHAKAGYV